MPALTEAEISALSFFDRQRHMAGARALEQAEAFKAGPRPALPVSDAPTLRAEAGEGPVLAAARERSRSTLLALLSVQGARFDVNETCSKGTSPLLHLTADRFSSNGERDEAMFEKLLAQGADPRFCDDNGLSPLRAAVVRGQSAFFAAYEKSAWGALAWQEPPMASLESHGYPTHLSKPAVDLDALSLAASLGHEKIARSLLRLGASPNASNPSGLSPLHCAQTLGVAQALIEAGADLFAAGPDGAPIEKTYASIPDAKERTALLNALIQARAALNPAPIGQSGSDDIQLALFEALAQGRLGMQMRRSRSVDLDRPTPDGRLLLAQATLNADWRAAEKLDKLGADWTARESTGASAASLLLAHAIHAGRDRPFGDGAQKATRAALTPIFLAQAKAIAQRWPNLQDPSVSVAGLGDADFAPAQALLDSLPGLLADGARWPKGRSSAFFAASGFKLIARLGEISEKILEGPDVFVVSGLLKSRAALTLGPVFRAQAEAHILSHPDTKGVWFSRDDTVPSPHGVLLAAFAGSARGETPAPRLYPWATQIVADFLPTLIAIAPNAHTARSWFACIESIEQLRSDSSLARSIAQSAMFAHPRHADRLAKETPRFFAAVEQAHLALSIEKLSLKKDAPGAPSAPPKASRRL